VTESCHQLKRQAQPKLAHRRGTASLGRLQARSRTSIFNRWSLILPFRQRPISSVEIFRMALNWDKLSKFQRDHTKPKYAQQELARQLKKKPNDVYLLVNVMQYSFSLRF
jgi:hypothetical protein